MPIKTYRDLQGDNVLRGQALIADIERRLREQETFEVRHPIASIIVMVLGLSLAMAVIVGYLYLGYGFGL